MFSKKYMFLAWMGKVLPSSLPQQLFEVIWNAEDQNNEFEMPDQTPSRLDLIES